MGWVHVEPAQGLPNVPVYDVQISPGAGRTIAFTHGRGAYALVDGSYLGQIVITSLQVTSNRIQLTFTSDLNEAYRVERSSSLTLSGWTSLIDRILGTGAVITTNGLIQSDSAEFYRIRRL